jgi:hypothetical protein
MPSRPLRMRPSSSLRLVICTFVNPDSSSETTRSEQLIGLPNFSSTGSLSSPRSLRLRSLPVFSSRTGSRRSTKTGTIVWRSDSRRTSICDTTRPGTVS